MDSAARCCGGFGGVYCSNCFNRFFGMEVNTVIHGNFLDNTLPDKCAQLIICDPPYFQVKGDFDFIWKDRESYLADVEKWAKECKRVLADNGTLFWWGHALNIAYSQIILDKYFNLINSLVWEKTETQTMKNSPESMRSFAPVTERLLMYDNGEDVSGLAAVYSDADCFKTIKEYMRIERSKLMQEKGFKTLAEFDNFINEWTNTKSVVSRHYFADSQYSFPTAEIYARMQQTGFWQRPYEALRQEYEALRRPFNQSKLQTDILRYSQEAHITGQYDHPTKKPEKLTRAIILTCSRPNDIVLVPFAGSGTEVAMAAKEGRRFVGYDIEAKYAKMAQERANKHLNTPTLF